MDFWLCEPGKTKFLLMLQFAIIPFRGVRTECADDLEEQSLFFCHVSMSGVRSK